VANPKRNFWLALFKNVLFRLAFGGFILLELALFVLLLIGISKLLPEDNNFVLGVLITSVLISPFGIGALSYLIFQRLTRRQYVLAQSQSWLAERHQANRAWMKRRKILKKWALWIPTLTVILVCSFFDYTWPVATHLLHPGRGKLVGYEVPIPLSWSIAYSHIGKDGDENSLVVIERYRGLIKAGSGLYLGTRRPFSTSNINFRSFPGGHPFSVEPPAKIISIRTLPFTKGTIECHDDVLPRWMTSGHYIRCSTPTGDFSGNFNGIDEDVPAFYQMLSSVKRLN
jgi:hypothetical protein